MWASGSGWPAAPAMCVTCLSQAGARRQVCTRVRGLDGKVIGSHLSKLCHRALAGVAQWIKCWSVSREVAGSIPSQGTCLGYKPGP